MNNKNLEKVEKVEKAAQAIDQGVKVADEKLSAVPSMMGEHKPKIIVGLTSLMVIALLRDPSLAIIGGLVLTFLYSSSILAAVKKQMQKKTEEKAVETKIEEKNN